MCGPRMPSSAGSRVSAASTITPTNSADEKPSVETYGTPANQSPHSAMATHMPANSDADPAVPIGDADRVMDREALVPFLAEPADDQQRVVDADTETDHRARARARRCRP